VLLLHVILHQLGHHGDRMQMTRGEAFDERYANQMLEAIWPSYVRIFVDPRRSRSSNRLGRTPG
jgi:hypothetical protein